MKLLCFPYAGASAANFLKWRKYFTEINVIAIDPPGRGSRLREPLCKTIEEMVDDVKKLVAKAIDKDEEYAVYGHSMGALLVYELLHDFLATGFQMPVHVFLSGRNAPHKLVEIPITQCSDEEFVDKVIAMEGVEPKFFEVPGLAKLIISILRADLGISEFYRCEKKKQRLPVDISFFFSSDDLMEEKEYVLQWSDYTTGFFQMYYFTGGHFFMFKPEQEKKIAEIIQETLSNAENNIPY